jgi:ATP-binding cassette subfamily C protein
MATASNNGFGPGIRDALLACKSVFVEAAVFSAFLNLLYLAPTLYMLQVYDRVIPSRGGLTLLMLTAIFIGAAMTIALLDLCRVRLLGAIAARLDRLLSRSIVDALMRVGKAPGMPRNASALREFDSLRMTLTGIGVMALFDVPWAPIYVFACFLLHWALGLMALLGCILLGLFSWLAERATKDLTTQGNRLSQMNFMAIDGSLAAAGTLHALGMREAMVSRHIRDRKAVTQTMTKANHKAAAYSSYVKALRLLMQSLALGLGALLAINQQISPGSIFAASLLVSRALAPIELITGAWKGLVSARQSYMSLGSLFEQRGELRTPTRLPDPVGQLSVENLTVASPARDRALIQGVNFDLEAGEMLGIVGPSGAGKSTLAKAIVGIFAPAGGTVRIDGASIEDWPEEQLATAVGYVPQEPTLFQGTIKENIARFETELGRRSAEEIDADVVRAAQLCGAHEFILRLPKGYDTELGWGGVGLSGGQAQRVTVARALYGQPRLLILDEPNSNLDAEGELALINAMDKLKREGVTVIIVAHNARVLYHVDKLLIIKNGRMEMFGSRAAVVERLNASGAPSNLPVPPSRSEPAAAAGPANSGQGQGVPGGQAAEEAGADSALGAAGVMTGPGADAAAGAPAERHAEAPSPANQDLDGKNGAVEIVPDENAESNPRHVRAIS